MVHGFKGARSLDGSGSEALLWIPTLSRGKRVPWEDLPVYPALRHTYRYLPNVPFPCRDRAFPIASSRSTGSIWPLGGPIIATSSMRRKAIHWTPTVPFRPVRDPSPDIQNLGAPN